jgi:hypothetical protein
VAAAAAPDAQPKPTAPGPDEARAEKRRLDEERRRLNDELDMQEKTLEHFEREATLELVKARLDVADAEDRLRALAPDRTSKQLEFETQKQYESAHAAENRLRMLRETTGPNHPDQVRFQDQYKEAQARLQALLKEQESREAAAAEKRHVLRAELFDAEERLHRIERRIDFHRRLATADVEAAAERLRHLSGPAAPAGPSPPALSEVNRKLDALQHDLAELRRELKRP